LSTPATKFSAGKKTPKRLEISTFQLTSFWMAHKYPFPLLLEFLLLFGGMPLLILNESRAWKLAALWFFACYALVMFKRAELASAANEWNWPAARIGLREVLPRFAVFASALTLFLLLIAPEKILSFPRQRPQMWAMVMLWYPILSALPQEIIYRSLYHHRYAKLFRGGMTQLIIAGIIFGWAHIIFKNPVAVVLCGIGGVMFSHTYLKHKSLALAWIEHSLYGCFVFTIGLGSFFYGMSVRQ